MEFLAGAPSFGSLIRRMDQHNNEAIGSYGVVEGEINFIFPWDVTEGEYILFAVEFLVTGDSSSIHTFRLYSSAGAGTIEAFDGLSQVSWNERFSAADVLRFTKVFIFKVTGSGSIQPSFRGVATAGTGTVQIGNCRMRGYTLRA